MSRKDERSVAFVVGTIGINTRHLLQFHNQRSVAVVTYVTQARLYTKKIPLNKECSIDAAMTRSVHMEMGILPSKRETEGINCTKLYIQYTKYFYAKIKIEV